MSTRSTDSPQSASHAGDGAHRIVVLANEVIGDQALVREVVRHVEGRPTQIRIVAPALVKSPLDLAAGDVDDEIDDARRRLEASIATFGQSGIEATGDVGEADPVLALEDALRLFPADEVIVVAHPRERATWLEENVVERARREVGVPFTVIEIEPGPGGRGGGAAVKAVREVAPARSREAGAEGPEGTYDIPMSTRDKLALLIGIAGTIALGIASIACADGQGSGHSGVGADAGTGSCAVPIGLGVGAFIVTVFHGAALLLMRGAGYRGRWESLVAYTLVLGIPPAVLIGVIFA
jgi:hypothetical protein